MTGLVRGIDGNLYLQSNKETGGFELVSSIIFTASRDGTGNFQLLPKKELSTHQREGLPTIWDNHERYIINGKSIYTRGVLELGVANIKPTPH